MANKRNKDIKQDPRWAKLVTRYRYDWLGLWLYLMPHKPPSWQQVIMLNEVSQGASKVSIASGHGTGKSYGSAMITLMFLLVFGDSQVYLVANSVAQVKAAVWKNIREVIDTLKKRHPWLAYYVILTESELYIRGRKGRWNCKIKACRQGHMEGLAGEHNPHFIYIVDEASGVSQEAFEVMGGAMSEDDNRMLMLSQPTRLVGTFYDSQTTLIKKKKAKKAKKLEAKKAKVESEKKKVDLNATGWTPLVFNSEQSPFVSDKFLLEKLREYGGNRESLEYRVRVRGLFPEKVAGYLLTLAECRKAQRANPRLASDWGYVALCDVGNGRDRSVLNILKVSGQGVDRRIVTVKIIEYDAELDPLAFAVQIKAECSEELYPNITIGVDGDGIGTAVIAKMETELGMSPVSIRWGFPCHNDADKKRFANKRAYAHQHIMYGVKQGRVKLDAGDKTLVQGSKLPFIINDKGVIGMMRKSNMALKGIPSPDRFDTYCLSMLISYVPASADVPESAKMALKEAEEWLDA
jgi:hypothetical protein